jgi:exonuclease III
MRISTWNVKWASARSHRGTMVKEVLASLNADVIVLTEGCAAVLPADGHVIDASSDWGYRVEDASRRKVLLWSKHPWTDVDSVGSEDLPPGRFVAGTTHTTLGELRIIGVCIPWRGAHVTHGHRDRRPWEDHSRFLEGLAPLLNSGIGPMVVAGDFNQRIPRTI